MPIPFPAKLFLRDLKNCLLILEKNSRAVPVIYISMKPSPSRWSMRDRMMKANLLIKDYLKQKKNAVFINVWDSMLGKNGEPIKDIFLEDNLHMNAKGYAIWQKLIEPHLSK